jgi:hypothetical protein
MVGIIILIFAFIPESPWWLVSKGKIDKAGHDFLEDVKASFKYDHDQ